MELKLKERQLLAYFRKNARLALTQISRQTGMPVSTIFDKLRRYEGKVITKHASLLNFTNLGYGARAKVFLKTPAENRQRLGSYLKVHPSINNVYRINNGYDYLAEVVFKTVQELEAFLEVLELEVGVTDKAVHYIIDEVAREQFMVN